MRSVQVRSSGPLALRVVPRLLVCAVGPLAAARSSLVDTIDFFSSWPAALEGDIAHFSKN